MISTLNIWNLPLHGLPAEALAGAATLCAILSQCLASTTSELPSEILCWTILPILLQVARGSDIGPSSAPSSDRATQPSWPGHLWIVAVAVVTACLCNTEHKHVAGFYVSIYRRGCRCGTRAKNSQPALTPLLLIAQKQFRPEFRAWGAPDSSWFSSINHTLLGACLVALFQVFILSTWHVRDPTVPIVALFALAIVYIALLPGGATRTCLPTSINLDAASFPLSRRIVFLLLIALGIEYRVFGLRLGATAPILIRGVAKALSWIFMTRIVRPLPY